MDSEGHRAQPSLNAQIDYYNSRWSQYEYATAFDAARAAFVLAAVGYTNFRQPRICDLGCGTGWVSNILSTIGPTTGLDLSDQAIERARKMYLRPQFQCVDLGDWRPPHGVFDIVVSQEVLEHVEDQPGYLRTAHELLREGGYLILTTPNRATLNAMPPDIRRIFMSQPIEKPLLRTELLRLLKPRFEPVRISSIILEQGHRGLRRAVNSPKLCRLLNALGVLPVYDNIRALAGYGLCHGILAVKN